MRPEMPSRRVPSAESATHRQLEICYSAGMLQISGINLQRPAVWQPDSAEADVSPTH